jgi:hypothetical protein
LKIIDIFVSGVNHIIMKRYLGLICLFYSFNIHSFSQTFTESNLPIVLITTDGGSEIPDSPRIFANMKVIFRGAGIRNLITDQNTPSYLNYNGRINIETRGSSSQTLPKKQYGLTTFKSDNTTKNDISLLGLPEDNDWILNGLGFEPSLIRDYLCYNLYRMMGEYASRTVYCEVVINGSYKGLYLLQEKIKQGPNRVDVMKIDRTDNRFPDISGGYISKADKTNAEDPVAWKMSSYSGTDDVSYIHVQPKPDMVTPEQNIYISSEFEKLRNTAFSGNSSPETGFPSIIDIPSFVDFMIISEFSANADAYQYSTYFHKDRNGKLRAGPIWDNNLTFGYDLSIWGFDRSKTYTWQFSNGDNEGSRFWRDLFNNPDYKCCLLKRWNQLIQPGQPLNYATVESLIDRTVATISEAEIRENNKWGTIPNFSKEIAGIKDFVKNRITWISNSIGSASCPVITAPPLVITKIMYNPDSTINFPDRSAKEFIEIQNTGNQTVDLTGVYFTGTGFVYQFPARSEIRQGAIKILANKPMVFLTRYGVPASGQFTRNLSNKGEKLVLADAFGNVIDSVRYSNQPPWPNADGNGYYLELIDPLSDNSNPSNWTASTTTIVSVREKEYSHGLKLYPTPVKDYLTIESSSMLKTVELFDSHGKTLFITQLNTHLYNLNMSSCSRGFYMVRVITTEGSTVRKIIKE